MQEKARKGSNPNQTYLESVFLPRLKVNQNVSLCICGSLCTYPRWHIGGALSWLDARRENTNMKIFDIRKHSSSTPQIYFWPNVCQLFSSKLPFPCLFVVINLDSKSKSIKILSFSCITAAAAAVTELN